MKLRLPRRRHVDPKQCCSENTVVSGKLRVAVFFAVPVVAMALALGAGVMKWQQARVQTQQAASTSAVQAAIDATVRMLSYHPDSVDKDLAAAREDLTGSFRDAYTSLTNDVVIPGAKQKHIEAAATVSAASPVSSSNDHAVVLVFVNQTTTIGSDPPSITASSVRVTLDKHEKRWLVSGFDPV
ncbi:hypothetical protein [Mycobacterium syngnathidarum]